MQQGKATPGALGLIADDLTPSLDARLGAAVDRRGVYIALVLPGSPADRAGARVGDIIASRDGQPVARARDLDSAGFENDAPISLIVDRAGETLTLTLDPPQSGGGKASKTGKIAGSLSAQQSR
jgi:S1-C subfamily serine protease